MKNYLVRLKTILIIIAAVVGPGIITAFADNDAGGVATYSLAASKFGYGILTTLVPITIVLLITQEIGARIAIVSEKGLGDLIRERYRIKVSVFIFALLLLVNFGVILQNLSGLKSAYGLFGLNIYVFLPLTVATLFLFVAGLSYNIVEKFFLALIVFYTTYIFSAILAKPDWTQAAVSLVYPTRMPTVDYLFTSVAVLGTTVTAWGQFFINSYIKDKKISLDKLKYSRWEVYIGALLTNLISFFIMVAVIATVYKNQIVISDGAEAALAIKPFAGPFASYLFAFGLLVAGFLGSAIVPLATAYAFSEFFGYEGSLDVKFHQSRVFYILFLLQIVAGSILVLMPEFSLFKITLAADFLNGMFLPLIIYFLYRFANNADIMGRYTNSRLQNYLLLGSGAAIFIGSLVGLLGKLFLSTPGVV